MLTEYIQAAMCHAQYELMENGRVFATIPQCPGTWGEGATEEEARRELQDVLESWLIVGLRHNDPFEIIDGVDLNPQPIRLGLDQVYTRSPLSG
jgi:predicted RNase H-like HicB family nuclease